MGAMVEEIAKRVMLALATRKPEAAPAPVNSLALVATPAPIEAPQAARPAAPPATRVEPVRRISPLRLRSTSILGLDINRPEPESSDTDRE